MKIDWKRKLTSRKFWTAVASFVTLVLVAFHVGENEASQIAAIITAGATVIGYIIGEGLTDASALDAQYLAQEDNKDELQ